MTGRTAASYPAGPSVSRRGGCFTLFNTKLLIGLIRMKKLIDGTHGYDAVPCFLN